MFIAQNENDITERVALNLAIATFVWWGLFPIYWHFLKGFPATTILAHRILWSFVFLLIVISLKARWSEVFAGLKDKKVVMFLSLSTILISVNWLAYIWAVTNEKVLECSLGYYINPLVNVLLGRIFFAEKLRKFQYLALAFAFAGVLILTISYGEVPYIALFLAFSFGFYSLCRKMVKIGSQPALMIETGIASIPAIIFLLFVTQGAIFADNVVQNLLLLGAGVFTVVPLVWIAIALKKLPLSIVGICQYISPTLQLIIGVVIFSEPFSGTQIITFVLIWIALIIFTLEGWTNQKKKNRLIPPI